MSQTQLIKKEDMLPPQLSIIPLDGKPIVPGLLLPIYVKTDDNIRELLEKLEKNGCSLYWICLFS